MQNMLGVPRTGAEMAQERRPFEPDADNTAVGKRDNRIQLQIFLSGSLSFVEVSLFISGGLDASQPGVRIRNMDIQLNGKPTSVEDNTTIGQLIRGKGLDPAAVVVERNLAIVPSDEWDQLRLQENDSLEILKFVGGG